MFPHHSLHNCSAFSHNNTCPHHAIHNSSANSHESMSPHHPLHNSSASSHNSTCPHQTLQMCSASSHKIIFPHHPLQNSSASSHSCTCLHQTLYSSSDRSHSRLPTVTTTVHGSPTEYRFALTSQKNEHRILSPSSFSNEPFYAFTTCPMCATCPTHLIPLDLIISVIRGEKSIHHKVSPYAVFLQSVTSFCLSPSSFVITQFLVVRDH